MEKTPNFTADQEARIRDASPLNLAKATALATEFGKKPRSIIAKAVRMNVPYEKQKPVTKTGEPVVRKENLVSRIAEYLPEGANVDGLEKASKPALVAVLAAFDALQDRVEDAEAITDEN